MLVLILFGVGMAVTRSLFIVRRAHSVEAVRKRLRTIHDDLASMSSTVTKIGQRLTADIIAIVGTYEQLGTANNDEGKAASTALRDVQQQLDALRMQPPALAVHAVLTQVRSMESAYNLLAAQYEAHITATSWTEQFRSVLRRLTRIFYR